MIELVSKGNYCNLRHAHEAVFSFFDDADALKDVVSRENAKLMLSALESGHASVSTQQPWRKLGVVSCAPSSC